MSKYRIKGHGKNPLWREKKICELGISPGNDVHDGDKLFSTMEWASRHFEEIVITLSDTLYRHNFKAEGLTDILAYKEGLHVGEKWLFKNRAILEQFKPSIKNIDRWDKWLLHPDFTQIYNDLLLYDESDEGFKASIGSDIENYINRKDRNDGHIQEDILRENCRLFLLEEIAAYILIGRTYNSAHIYPAHDMTTTKYMRLEKTPDNLKGIEKIAHVRITLNRRSSAHATEEAA